MQLEKIASVPVGSKSIVEGAGVLVWVKTLGKELSSTSALYNYAGVEIFTTETECLYFFKSINTIPMAFLYKTCVLRSNATVHIFPGTLFIDEKYNEYVDYARTQEFVEDEKYLRSIFIHKNIAEIFSSQQGISLDIDSYVQDTWCEVVVDRNASVIQVMHWSIVIQPAVSIVGEKNSALLWQNTMHAIEEFLRSKLVQYTNSDNFLLQLAFTHCEQVKAFISEYQMFISSKMKQMGEDAFSATSVILKLQKPTNIAHTNVYSFYKLDQESILFNHFHTDLCTALILKKDFVLVQDRMSPTLESWVALIEKQEITSKDVSMLAPANIQVGKEKSCFYCGMRNHSLVDCPTHAFLPEEDVWKKIAEYPFQTLLNISANITKMLEKNPSIEELAALYADKKEKGLFVKALFSVTQYSQLRSILGMFSRRSKTQKKFIKKDSKIEYFYKRITEQEIHQVEYDLLEFTRQQRDYRYYTFLGFTSLEKKDFTRAIEHWKEAELLSYTPQLVAWHLYLQGRCYEIQGKYNNALSVYKLAISTDNSWKEAHYRYIVTLIQLGRLETAMKLLEKHLENVPEDFIRILLDTQARQGYLEITRLLSRLWEGYAVRIEYIEKSLENEAREIAIWGKNGNIIFEQLHTDFLDCFDKRTNKDFLTYSIILQKYTEYKEELQKNIYKVMEHTSLRIERLSHKLEIITEHAKWMPVRSNFKNFYTELDDSVEILEKLGKVDLEIPENYEFVLSSLESTEARIEELEKSIHFMRVLRDSSLFLIMFLKSFILWEVIIAVLLVLGIPAILYYAQSMGVIDSGMPTFSIQWSLQKNSIMVATAIVFIIVGSSTMIRFKKRKREILQKFAKGIRVNIL